jgi:hypothetical protein
MYPDSEILFPPRCIQQLRDLRGPDWQRLIRRIASLPHNHEEVLAFGLLMIKLGSCLTCDLDSYRASLGCCTCARRTISGFKKDDQELLALYQKALTDVQAYTNKEDLHASVALILKENLQSSTKRRERMSPSNRMLLAFVE